MLPSHQFITARALFLASVLLSISLAAIAVSGYQQRVHIDEAWLGEQAYWQAEDGVRRSELFRGLLDYDEHVLVGHKLFVWLGSKSVKIFGWHLWALRIVPLLSAVTLIGLMWFYLRSRAGTNDALLSVLGLLYLVAAPLFFRFVNLYRPEILLVACGFGSFLLLSEHIRSEKLWQLVSSSFLAGVGVLVHLNGVIFIGAGVVALLWLRRWTFALGFLVLAVIVSGFYFYDVIGQWDQFWYQFRSDPALDRLDLQWYAPLWRLVNEHKRLFRKPEVIFASALFFAALFQYWRSAPKNSRWIAVYCVGLVLGLGAFAQGKTVAYTILLVPMAAVVVAYATKHWLLNYRESPKWAVIAVSVLWLSFLGYGLYDNSVFAFTQKRDVAQSNRLTARFIPHGASVLAPLDFIFEEIANYQIRGLEGAAWIIKQNRPELGDIHKSVHAPDFLQFAQQGRIQAVILEDYLFTRVNLKVPDVGDTVMGYTAVGRVEELSRLVLTKSD